VTWCIVFARRETLRLAMMAAVGVLMIAVSFARSALYADLEARWRDAIEKTPANGRAYDNLASVELRANPPRIAVADSILHRAMAVDSGFVPAWVRSATIAMSQNRLADAAALLERALRLHPGDASATEKYGKVLLAERRPDLALPYVRQFAEFSPSGESLTTLGLTYLMTRQLDSAIVVLERASRRDSMRVDARRYLASALVEQERGREAIPYIQQAIRLDPSSGITFGLLGVAYAQAELFDEAARAAGEAVAKAGSNPVVFVLAGRALQSAGYFGDAAKYLERAVRLDPNDPQALTRLGMAHASLGDAAVATQMFKRALVLAPGYPLAVKALEQSGR
jgi:tetratricopeptide (TPR) repeat protein